MLLLGLFVLVYLNFAGRRRAQRRRLELDQRLVPGAEVVTTSGLHGSVDEVDDDGTVLLEIAPGWVTRWEKAAVARVLDTPEDADPDAEPDARQESADGAVETAETPEAVPASEPTPEPGTHPSAEPGARPLPGTAPPDRA